MKKTTSNSPALDHIRVNIESADINKFPFSLEIIQNLKTIPFHSKVTFLVGENGAGKSTILEAIAVSAGFGPEGGSRNISFKTSENSTYLPTEELSKHMVLSWRKKPMDGYFFRAETFYNIANQLDLIQKEGGQYAFGSYGNKSLHTQSHGESFLSFFNNRLHKDGFFILDEPEAALSVQRQLSLLVIINELCKSPNVQFIIATHSPILLAYPNSTIYSCDNKSLTPISYTQTDHYQTTRQFLNNHELYLKHLFSE
jgi:predicted ATPase